MLLKSVSLALTGTILSDKLKNPTDRQIKLMEFFVTREAMSELKIKFLIAATKDLVAGIDFFEKRTELHHVSRAKMEDILRNQILKLHDDPAVKNADDDLNVATKKSGPELLKVDIDDEKTLLNNKRVFVGQEVTHLIKEMGLKPDSSQLEWFFKSVFKFHRTVAAKLIGYFGTGLTSTELDYMSALSSVNRTNMMTSYKLKYLAKSFSKVVDNICPIGGMDNLQREIRHVHSG